MSPHPLGPDLFDPKLSDILRDFVDAHAQLRRLAAHYRAGSLAFDDVQALVGEADESVLYRLKERCHLLFRGDGVGSPGVGTLLDLAVGALFHEAMKFRENFYQRAAYGPKVRSLRDARVEGAGTLLHEFEKILEASSCRQDEALREAEVLLDQSVGQLRALLDLHRESGVLARTLLERGAQLESVFGEPLDALLGALYGSASEGFAFAGHAYLDAGFFAEAAEAFRGAAERGASPAGLDPLRAYAEGMQAYLDRRYGTAVDRLGSWLASGVGPADPHLADLALAAVARIGQLLEEGDDGKLPEKACKLAAALHQQLEGLAGVGRQDL